ncbi:MAG: cellulase family glycosylhydrolase [Terrimicrobiaceae bacterium]
MRGSLPVTLLAAFFSWTTSAYSESQPLPTDRARVAVAEVADPFGGPDLKVLRTDANTPLRAGTAWIWEKDRQEEPDYRTRQLARMERAVNYASANGMYVIINSHNKIPDYNEAYANALWTCVAPYFANRTHVLYEAANEPMSGIGNNGSMTPNPDDNPADNPRIQALRRTFDIIRAGAPDTHVMILTPNGINDFAHGTGLGNLAAAFADMPGVPVDWNKTSVGYHLYNNDRDAGCAANAANLRNLHSRFPAWPSENNFPSTVSNAALGITDSFRSPSFDDDTYVNQTCERLGLGWGMWNINGQTQLDKNWAILWQDAVTNHWTWESDPPSHPEPKRDR